MTKRYKRPYRTACYWIIGRDNKEQQPAVAVDILNDKGEPIGETWTKELQHVFNGLKDLEEAAERVAVRYAALKGVMDCDVWDDPDSTECFANC